MSTLIDQVLSRLELKSYWSEMWADHKHTPDDILSIAVLAAEYLTEL